MTDKVLFVDDEPAVLDGYKRMFHKEFEIETAVGGEAGLALIQNLGPYAIVVSDMRMPIMDGVQFLSRARKLAPETVRMVLTGYADVKSAMDAVNEGNLFRFLDKPCDKDTLGKALTAALIQYRLVIAEKELLENTLMGSIKVLTDVLSLANPAAFGRSMRVRRYVQEIAKKLGLESPWRLEAAAMLSQLGCVTLDPETIESAYCGRVLSSEEQSRFDMHPSIARDLLRNIPRLEPIAWMIGEQRSNPPKVQDPQMPESVVAGATILQVALAYDDMRIRGLSKLESLAELKKEKNFPAQVVNALADISIDSSAMEKKLVPISALRPGMILEEEIRTLTGFLLVAKGHEISSTILIRLRDFQHKNAIPETILALVPVEHAMTKGTGSIS